MIQKKLKGDGDFRSQECIDILKKIDIVITNPPFSLFGEYFKTLMEYDKKFIIIGQMNCITYKYVLKNLIENKVWLGTKNNISMEFIVPNDYQSNIIDENENKILKITNICWFTNLSHDKMNDFLILNKKYSPETYPKFDNYPAINVDKTKDIPMDYKGLMGVPISFMTKYNHQQFDIIDGLNRYPVFTNNKLYKNPKGTYGTNINGKPKYFRLIIKNKTL